MKPKITANNMEKEKMIEEVQKREEEHSTQKAKEVDIFHMIRIMDKHNGEKLWYEKMDKSFVEKTKRELGKNKKANDTRGLVAINTPIDEMDLSTSKDAKVEAVSDSYIGTNKQTMS